MKILQPNSFLAILPAHSIAHSSSSIETRKGTRTLRSVKREQPVLGSVVSETSKRHAMPSMKTAAAISTCKRRGLGLGWGLGLG